MFLIMLKCRCQGGKKKSYSSTCVIFIMSQILKFGGSFHSLLHPVFFCIFYMVGCGPVVLAFAFHHFQVLFLLSKRTLQPLSATHSGVTRTGKCRRSSCVKQTQRSPSRRACGARSEARRAAQCPKPSTLAPLMPMIPALTMV